MLSLRAAGYFEILEILLTLPQVPRRFVVNMPHFQTATSVL